MKGIRSLAAASAGYCAAIFLSHYLLSGESLICLAALCAVLFLCAFLLDGLNRRRLIIISLAAAVGFAHYAVHSANTVDKCAELDGQELLVSARVTDYPDVRDGYTLLELKITGGAAPKLNAVAAVYTEDEYLLTPGDEISLKLKLRSAAERYGEDTDSNISKGVYLSGTVTGEITKTGRWEYSFLYAPKFLGHALHSVVDSLFPEDAAPFLKALLAGYKDDYYQNDRLYASMNMAGLSHVVAVSGMHVAFLVGAIQAVIGRNRRSSLLCIILVWIFVAMTGSPPSAVRAGVMISLMLLAPVLGRINDQATTLSFALALILIFNPFSAGSVGLQLSFAAVAGILLFSQPLYAYFREKISPPRPLRRAADYVMATLASSISVSAFTFPLLALHFGYISIVAPIMNILCLWAISLLFTGGYAVCLLGLLLPGVAAFAGSLLSYLVRYIAATVEFSAKLPYTSLYTGNKYELLWLASAYLLPPAYLLARRYIKKLSPLVPSALCLALLAGAFVLTERDMRADEGTINVMSVGNGQCIAATCGESCAVIDCGSSGVVMNAGAEMANYLCSLGHSDVDCLVLTHLHTDHASGAERLMNLMQVRTLILPENASDTSSDGMLESLLACAEENGTEVVYITQDTALEAGDIRLNIIANLDVGSKNENGLMADVAIGGYNMLVTGDAEMSVERALVKSRDLSGTELLIVPHHGSKYSTSEELLMAANPEVAVISTGYNSYGHPTEETLDRLASFGIETLRTDECGSVIIHIAQGD